VLEIDEVVGETEVKEPELVLARQLIESLIGEFEPKEALVSNYRRDLRSLLEAKLQGEETARPEPAGETPVVDRIEALKRSVAEAKKRKAPRHQARRNALPKRRAPGRREPRAG
jgi:DNA end-binding protein Ku